MHLMCALRGVRSCRFSCMRVLLIVHVLYGLRGCDHAQPCVYCVRDVFIVHARGGFVRFK